MLWHIQYDDSIDEEEFLTSELKQRHELYVKEQLHDTVVSTKLPATGRRPPSPTLLTIKKSNTKRKRLDT